MRSGWLLLIGLAAGFAAGWVLRDAGEDPGTAGSDGSRAGAGTAKEPGVPSGLTGRATPQRRAAAALRTLEALGFGEGRRTGRGLEALAMLHALAGSEEDFLRVARQALAEGVDADDILRALRQLPSNRRGAVLEALLESHPDAEFDPYEVARIFEQAGNAQRALAIVREALPQMNDFDDELAWLLLKLDPAGGTSLLFRLEGSELWDSDALNSLRAILVEKGLEAELLPFLQRALKERPGDRDTVRLLARLSPEEAIAHMRARLAEDPADASNWSFLARLEAKRGDVGAAFDAYHEAAKRRPSPKYYGHLMDLDPARALPLIVEWSKDSKDDEVIGTLAEAYLEAGDKDRAVEVFLRAHEHDPNDKYWIKSLIELAPERAVEALGKLIAPSPTAAKARLLGQYGDALRAAGREAEAFDQYLLAHGKDPDSHVWQRSLVDVDPRRALAVLDAHIKSMPDDASGRGAYGMALAAAGRKKEAIKHLEHAMAEGNAELWFDELVKFDEKRALEGLHRRARQESRNEELWGTLGRELERRGRTNEAREAFLRAMRLDPSNPDWTDALRDLK